MKKLLLSLVLLCGILHVSAQPPNDEPIGAPLIPVYAYGGPGNTTAGTTVGATYSVQPPTPSSPSTCGCTYSVPSQPRDVWYRFNTGSYSHYFLNIVAGNFFGTVGYIRIYSDTLASSVPILCKCAPSSGTALQSFGFTGLALNTNYFMAISSKVGTSGFWGPFDIKLEGANIPLPITLEYLKLKQINEGNLIEWKLQSFSNINTINLERRNEGEQNFKTVYQMEEINFEAHDYIDKHAPLGKNNYRLVGIDIDGNKTYSNVASITNVHQKNIEIYPNPSYNMDELKITRKHFADKATLQIFNPNGILVLEKNITTTQQIIRLKETAVFAKGIYIVKYKSEDNDYPETFKWVKM